MKNILITFVLVMLGGVAQANPYSSYNYGGYDGSANRGGYGYGYNSNRQYRYGAAPGRLNSRGYNRQPQRYLQQQQPKRQQPAKPKGNTPDQLLKSGIAQINEYLKQPGDRDLSKVLEFAKSQLAGYFDFAHISRLAAGKLAREMDGEQHLQLEERIQDMFFASMAQQLAGYAYTNHKITFYPPRRGNRGTVSVSARITHPQGYPVLLKFRFHATTDGWKVFDVATNNSSAVQYYRYIIAETARKHGIDAVLQGDIR